MINVVRYFSCNFILIFAIPFDKEPLHNCTSIYLYVLIRFNSILFAKTIKLLVLH